MPKAEIKLDSTVVGNIAFEIQNIYAQGGPDFPKLDFRLDLALSAFKNFSKPGQYVYPVTGLILSGEFFSPPDRAVADFRDEIGLYAPDVSPWVTQFRLLIPLDMFKINRIEQSRDGNLRVALHFRMLLAVHLIGGTSVQNFRTARIDPIDFSIPKSQWVEQLLPELGYGKLELVEVRFSEGLHPEGLPKSVEEIRQAQKYLTEGEWDNAVAHCRNAIEAIPDSRNLQLPAARTFGAKVDTFVSEHLQTSLGEKQAKLVADELKLLWDVSSRAVHPSPAGYYFKRADAEFLLRNTIALVEYVSKLLA